MTVDFTMERCMEPTVLAVDIDVHPVADFDVDLGRPVVLGLSVTLTSASRLTLTLATVTLVLHLAHESICNKVVVV